MTGGQDKVLRVFDVEQGHAVAELAGHQQPIKAIVWSPNNPDVVMSGGADEAIRVWDLRAMTQIALIVSKAPVASMELSRNGKYITAAAGREVSFWDAQSFVPVKTFPLPLDLNSASLHPDATKFAAGGSDFYVHVFDFQTGEEIDVHKGHHGPVHCVRFAPDGETIASGSEDGTIRLWQTALKPYGLWQLQNGLSSTPPKSSLSTTPKSASALNHAVAHNTSSFTPPKFSAANHVAQNSSSPLKK